MRGTCVAVGEIDLATASAFGAAMCHAIDDADAHTVFVDCSAVTFMGSAGYRVLLDATAYAARRGHTLVIRNMSSSCARLMRICGGNNALNFERPREPEHRDDDS